jgi:hypothetical protein
VNPSANPKVEIPVNLMTGYSCLLLSLGNYGYDEITEKLFDWEHFVARVNHYPNKNLKVLSYRRYSSHSTAAHN